MSDQQLKTVRFYVRVAIVLVLVAMLAYMTVNGSIDINEMIRVVLAVITAFLGADTAIVAAINRAEKRAKAGFAKLSNR